MALNNLKDLYVEQLRDLYSAENQILKALPQMAEKASHQELRSAFEEHRTVTERQVERLDRIFSDLGENPKGHHCKGMEGLIKEGQELMGEKAADDVLDSGLIAAAQRVEHYEMAGYGTVRTYADMLGQQEHARLLQQTLDE
ncbi:MAG TPA: ferritin-like domain-containing protein, partial [Longimicrobiaceae bacterium]|nr:ferritin-like domain-containing protein [Longimicrobiaceae bacterium]